MSRHAPSLRRIAGVLAFLGLALLTPPPEAEGSELVLIAPSAQRFQFSPDSKWIAFTVHDGENENLYVVPSIGGTPTLLTGGEESMSNNGEPFRFTPDSTRIVFAATSAQSFGAQLFSVPVSGPAEAAIKISGGTASRAYVWKWFITPDGQSVVYISEEDACCYDRLFVTPVAGPASDRRRLDDLPDDYSEVENFSLSSDGSRALYLAFNQQLSDYTLWSVPVVGPPSDKVNLSGDHPEGTGVRWPGDDIPTTANLAVFDGNLTSADRIDVYSARLETSAGNPDRLSKKNSQMHGGGFPRLSDDGNYVVFSTAEPMTGQGRLVSTPTEGPAGRSRFVSTDAGYLFESRWRIAPTSTHVLYRIDAELNLRHDLFSAPITGLVGDPVRLSPPIPDADEITEFEFVVDGTSVAFGVQRNGQSVEGYLVPIDGSSSPVALWGHPCFPNQSDQWLITRLGEERAILACGRERFGQKILYLLRVNGELEPQPLALIDESFYPPGTQLWPDYSWSPDGNLLGIHRLGFNDDSALYVRRVPMFYDGFESGGTGNWSVTEPSATP